MKFLHLSFQHITSIIFQKTGSSPIVYIYQISHLTVVKVILYNKQNKFCKITLCTENNSINFNNIYLICVDVHLTSN